jgi:hypothetical protein
MKNQNSIVPKIGMGVTINIGSDQVAATIVKMSKSSNKIVLQRDKSIRIDNNGISESQSYLYERDLNGETWTATLRKDGRYRLLGCRNTISLNFRREYCDPSF